VQARLTDDEGGPECRCVCTILPSPVDDVHKSLFFDVEPHLREFFADLARRIQRVVGQDQIRATGSSASESRNLSAPGIIAPSRISTPSMSQEPTLGS